MGLEILTGKQYEVALLCAEGKTNKEIGDKLGIVENTVRSHMTTIFRTLGIKSRTQLVVYVLAAKAAGRL